MSDDGVLLRIRNASRTKVFRVRAMCDQARYNDERAWRGDLSLGPSKSILLSNLTLRSPGADALTTLAVAAAEEPEGSAPSVFAVFQDSAEGARVELARCAGAGAALVPVLVKESHQACSVGPWRCLVTFLLIEQCRESALTMSGPHAEELSRWLAGEEDWRACASGSSPETSPRAVTAT